MNQPILCSGLSYAPTSAGLNLFSIVNFGKEDRFLLFHLIFSRFAFILLYIIMIIYYRLQSPDSYAGRGCLLWDKISTDEYHISQQMLFVHLPTVKNASRRHLIYKWGVQIADDFWPKHNIRLNE